MGGGYKNLNLEINGSPLQFLWGGGGRSPRRGHLGFGHARSPGGHPSKDGPSGKREPF